MWALSSSLLTCFLKKCLLKEPGVTWDITLSHNVRGRFPRHMKHFVSLFLPWSIESLGSVHQALQLWWPEDYHSLIDVHTGYNRKIVIPPCFSILLQHWLPWSSVDSCFQGMSQTASRWYLSKGGVLASSVLTDLKLSVYLHWL